MIAATENFLLHGTDRHLIPVDCMQDMLIFGAYTIQKGWTVLERLKFIKWPLSFKRLALRQRR
jgi:hypothetical protein